MPVTAYQSCRDGSTLVNFTDCGEIVADNCAQHIDRVQKDHTR